MELFIDFLYGFFMVVGSMIFLALICIIGAFLWCLAGTIILRIAGFFDNLQK